MKKTLPLLLALLFVGATLNAQVDYKTFRMGFRASPNVSWMQPKDRHYLSDGAALRFGFGFVADIFFAENYAFGTGINVMRNGGKLSYLETERIGDKLFIYRMNRTYSNQYVEVPLTFKLRTNEIGYMTYWAQFGFGAGINIGARGDDEKIYLTEQAFDAEGALTWAVSERPTATVENNQFSDDIRLFRGSMIIAAGVEYNLAGNTSLLFGITYNNGLTNSSARKDVIKTDSEDKPIFSGPGGQPETTRLNAVANSIELNLGIMF